VIENEIREFDWVSHATSDIESQFQCEEDDADVERLCCTNRLRAKSPLPPPRYTQLSLPTSPFLVAS